MPNVKHGRAGNLYKHKPYCFCGALGTYNDEYDAYYCLSSGVWLEEKCDDEGCDICPDRPEKNI